MSKSPQGAREAELTLKFSVSFGSAGIRTQDLVQAGHGALLHPSRSPAQPSDDHLSESPLPLSQGQAALSPLCFSVGLRCAGQPWLKVTIVFANLMTFCPLDHFHILSKFRASLSASGDSINVPLK